MQKGVIVDGEEVEQLDDARMIERLVNVLFAQRVSATIIIIHRLKLHSFLKAF